MYVDPLPVDKPLKDTRIPKWLNTLDDHLRKIRGVNQVPLAYVTRVDVAVRPHTDDPTADYPNIDSEMTARAPHDQYVYVTNNRTL